MQRTFTAYIEYDPDTALYVGSIPGLRGAHSQGATLDELQRNLQEVVELILDERKEEGEVSWITRCSETFCRKPPDPCILVLQVGNEGVGDGRESGSIIFNVEKLSRLCHPDDIHCRF